MSWSVSKNLATSNFRDEATLALPDLDQAVALNPQSIDARAGRAYADLATGDYEAAIEDYSEAIRRKPDAEFHVALGIAYVMHKDGASATRALEAATALHSDNESIPLWLILAGGEIPRGRQQLGYARGSLSEEQILASTVVGDSTKQAQRQCQAHFYTGALDQRSGRAADAKRQPRRWNQGGPLTVDEKRNHASPRMKVWPERNELLRLKTLIHPLLKCC
jgi:tetratricopeptide (TPR) repeat protein